VCVADEPTISIPQRPRCASRPALLETCEPPVVQVHDAASKAEMSTAASGAACVHPARRGTANSSNTAGT
jgi:hypothetical protein